MMPLPDLAFEEALVYLMTTLKQVKIKLTDKINEIIDQFISMLPMYIRNLLEAPE